MFNIKFDLECIINNLVNGRGEVRTSSCGRTNTQKKRGRPKSTKSVEQQKEDKRLRHREEQRRSNKKMMMITNQCKKKREARKKKARARFAKLLGP